MTSRFPVRFSKNEHKTYKSVELVNRCPDTTKVRAERSFNVFGALIEPDSAYTRTVYTTLDEGVDPELL